MISRISAVFVILLAGLAGAKADWRAAAKRINITPEKPMWMGGYSARRAPGSGKTTELYAKILVLEDGRNKRLAIVTLDLIGVPRSLRTALEKRVNSDHGLVVGELMLNASHSHSGPMIRLIPGFKAGQPDRASFDRVPDDEEEKYVRLAQAYMRDLEDSIVRSIGDCIKRLAPAQLLFSQARCGFAMNRRLPVGDRFLNSPNPDGPVDHSVPVLQVRDDKKRIQAILFGYACHATTLSYMTFSADYPGWAQKYLEDSHPNAVAMFVAGCGGDQNPYPRRKPHWASRHGRSLADAVEAALIANPTAVKGNLRTAFEYIDLDYATPPTRAQLELKAKSKDRYDQRHAQFLLEYLDAAGSLRKTYPYPVHVLRFGDSFSMIALGGEVVVDYSLRFKRELKGRIWVAGYSNDLPGYIPSLRVLKEGGYEGGGAMRYVRSIPHPGPWAESIEQRIVSKVHDLCRSTEK